VLFRSACGSGAFPMGILHKMVNILQKLDPDNEEWKKLQIEKATKEAEGAFKIENQKERDSRLKEISNIFENNASDYGRKLFLIENCIFGVDIQPIAVQISKLRFFISLVVEQIPTQNADDNYGIKPLPNLETKFVAANTLIGLTEYTLSYNEEIIAKENELKQVRHEYFTANNRQKKQSLQKKDKKLREELAKSLKRIGFAANSADLIAGWNPYDQNASAPFFDAEWMFGLTNKNAPLNGTTAGENGYFDVVIGNPPYGGKYSEGDKAYFLENYKCTKTIKNLQKGSSDTYALFLEKAHRIVAKNGTVIMIVNMSVVTSDSITALHNILFRTCGLIQVSNYMDRPVQIFPEAHTRTSIIKFIKDNCDCKNLLTTKLIRWDGESELSELINNLEFVNSRKYTLYGRLPKIGQKIELSILAKVFNNINKPINKLVYDKNGIPIYYRKAGGGYYNVITNYSTTSGTSEGTLLFDQIIANSVGAILSSSLFWWFQQIYTDCFNLKSYELESFTVPYNGLTPQVIKKLEKIYANYLLDIERNANIRVSSKKSNYKIASFKEYKIGHSKHLIDKIDNIVCPLYGLTPEETDFIKNYEIEFRMRGVD
jgi:hypothetical protein